LQIFDRQLQLHPPAIALFHRSTTVFSDGPRWKLLTMGTGKKEKTRLVRQGKTGDGMANVKVKGENFYR